MRVIHRAMVYDSLAGTGEDGVRLCVYTELWCVAGSGCGAAAALVWRVLRLETSGGF